MDVLGNVSYEFGEAMITVTAHEKCDLDPKSREIQELAKDPDLEKKVKAVKEKEEALLAELKAVAGRFHDIEEEGVKLRMAMGISKR